MGSWCSLSVSLLVCDSDRMTWLPNAAHARWLESETDRLIDFARASAVPDGFGYLDSLGSVDEAQGVQLWITCRMTHVFALAHLMGRPGAGPLVDHGVAALTGALHDDDNGGWFARVGGADGDDRRKEAYGHAFVILAASSAVAAGRDGARVLLGEALSTHSERFWDESAGLARESFDADWSGEEDYRGANANMHTVEAYLAAADVTSDTRWLRRAESIVERMVHGYAREHGWRLPEHFDTAWTPLLEYNAQERAHPFRPYGATIGHGFEWARLTVQCAAQLGQAGLAAPEWMLADAKELYAASARDGWAADGHEGFVYTIDFDGDVVVPERMHWVACEGIAAAAVLHSRTKDERYAADYTAWWDHAAVYFADRMAGSWWHERAADGSPSSTVWSGKPDVYHAAQATLLPRLPASPSLASSLAAGNLA